jgi:hypothetical protein
MLKLNVGASRKIADNHYGSRGASVHLELELESGLAAGPERLREKIRQLFGVVREAVAEELNGTGQQSNGACPHMENEGFPIASQTGSPPSQHQRLATAPQVKALYAISRSQKTNLATLLRERFAVAGPEELSLRQASQLIDQLKGTANGQGKAQ